MELEGYEADDILGTLSLRCAEKGQQCLIATGDRDSLQLVGENVTVIDNEASTAPVNVRANDRRGIGMTDKVGRALIAHNGRTRAVGFLVRLANGGKIVGHAVTDGTELLISNFKSIHIFLCVSQTIS